MFIYFNFCYMFIAIIFKVYTLYNTYNKRFVLKLYLSHGHGNKMIAESHTCNTIPFLSDTNFVYMTMRNLAQNFCYVY